MITLSVLLIIMSNIVYRGTWEGGLVCPADPHGGGLKNLQCEWCRTLNPPKKGKGGKRRERERGNRRKVKQICSNKGASKKGTKIELQRKISQLRLQIACCTLFAGCFRLYASYLQIICCLVVTGQFPIHILASEAICTQFFL